MKNQKWYTQEKLVKLLENQKPSISRWTFFKMKHSGELPQPDMMLGDTPASGVIYFESTVQEIMKLAKERKQRYLDNKGKST